MIRDIMRIAISILIFAVSYGFTKLLQPPTGIFDTIALYILGFWACIGVGLFMINALWFATRG